jgi:daunorubicin resistance ABC transporter ATP-binding subunit
LKASRGRITVIDLVKAYGQQLALDGVSLEVAPGSVHGLLGPNGAGKTTMVRILATLLAPNGGRAIVSGHDVVSDSEAVRREIGLTGQFTAVDELLTGREMLEMLGRLLGLVRREARSRANELLERFDLAEARDRRVSTYSGGMRRRLDLAASLVVSPSVLFLDEPTTGLDPRSRLELWTAVRDLAAAGTTVLLTTQYLEEADRLADRITVIDHGRVVAEGTPAELKAGVGTSRLELVLPDAATFDRARRKLDGRIVAADAELLTIDVDTDRSARSVRAVLDELAAAEVVVDGLSVGSPTLDDVFFALTGRSTASAEVANNV